MVTDAKISSSADLRYVGIIAVALLKAKPNIQEETKLLMREKLWVYRSYLLLLYCLLHGFVVKRKKPHQSNNKMISNKATLQDLRMK